MGALSFEQFRAQAINLYRARRYGEAHAYLSAHSRIFPAHTDHLIYFRACVAARAGRTAEALSLLSEALTSGRFFHPDLLEQSADLAPVRQLREFAHFRKVNRAAHQRAQAAEPPYRRALRPGGTGPFPMLVALHGNGGRADTALDAWAPLARLGWLVMLPQSTQLFAPEYHVWNSREQAHADVAYHIQATRQEHPIDGDQVILGGFARGGAMALRLALEGKIACRGFIAMAPSLPVLSRGLLNEGAGQGLRGCIIAGEKDLPALSASRSLTSLLASLAVPCRLIVVPGLGHAYPERFATYLEQAVSFITDATER